MLYYFFAILNDIIILFGITGVFLLAFAFILFIISKEGNLCEKEEKRVKKYAKISLITAFILFILCTFIPNQKQLAFIIAAPYILENQELKDASKNTSEIIKLGTEYIKTVLESNVEIEKDK